MARQRNPMLPLEPQRPRRKSTYELLTGRRVVARELLVASYTFVGDPRPRRIVRLDGTRVFRAYLDGELVGEFGSKSAAQHAVRKGVA